MGAIFHGSPEDDDNGIAPQTQQSVVIPLKRGVDQKQLRKILTVGGPVAAAHKEGHPGLTFFVTTEVGVV